MSFFKLASNASENAKITNGLKHEVHVAHVGTGIPAGRATTTGTPSRKAIALAKHEPALDGDFKSF